MDYARKNLNITAAEVGDQDMINLSTIAFAVVSSDNKLAISIIDKISYRIEENYQVEILEENRQRLI